MKVVKYVTERCRNAANSIATFGVITCDFRTVLCKLTDIGILFNFEFCSNSFV